MDARDFFSFQFTRYDKYTLTEGYTFSHKKIATLPVRKLRAVYYGNEYSWLQGEVRNYRSYLHAFMPKLTTLTIRWNENGRTLDGCRARNANSEIVFLHAMSPLWYRLIKAVPRVRLELKALSIEFNWTKMKPYANLEAGQGEFNTVWAFLRDRLSKILDYSEFKKLSLALPAPPEDHPSGCLYYSENFIQEFVKRRELTYLRLLFKTEPPSTGLIFAPDRLTTFELVFSYLKGSTRRSRQLIQQKKLYDGPLFNQHHRIWNAFPLRNLKSFKIKYGPFLNDTLVRHLAEVFPILEQFSFTAFNGAVYQQGDFTQSLTLLVQLCTKLRVIRLIDGFDKRHLHLANYAASPIGILGDRAREDPHRPYAFYLSKGSHCCKSCPKVLKGWGPREKLANFRIHLDDFSPSTNSPLLPLLPEENAGNQQLPPRPHQPLPLRHFQSIPPHPFQQFQPRLSQQQQPVIQQDPFQGHFLQQQQYWPAQQGNFQMIEPQAPPSPPHQVDLQNILGPDIFGNDIGENSVYNLPPGVVHPLDGPFWQPQVRGEHPIAQAPPADHRQAIPPGRLPPANEIADYFENLDLENIPDD